MYASSCCRVFRHHSPLLVNRRAEPLLLLQPSVQPRSQPSRSAAAVASRSSWSVIPLRREPALIHHRRAQSVMWTAFVWHCKPATTQSVFRAGWGSFQAVTRTLPLPPSPSPVVPLRVARDEHPRSAHTGNTERWVVNDHIHRHWLRVPLLAGWRWPRRVHLCRGRRLRNDDHTIVEWRIQQQRGDHGDRPVCCHAHARHPRQTTGDCIHRRGVVL